MAYIDIEGMGYKVPVLFGEEGNAFILDIATLEILGLEAGPITDKLKPTGSILL